MTPTEITPTLPTRDHESESITAEGAASDVAATSPATSSASIPPAGTRAARQPRGVGASTCKDDRGRRAWQQLAVASERFDQVDYRESWGRVSGGLCDGMVRESMRRLDRDLQAGGGAANLVAAVRGMATDAAATATRGDLFGRIERFQTQRHTLGLSHYSAGESVRFNAGSLSRNARIDALAGSLFGRLRQPNDLAYLQLSLESGTDRQDYGHAIVIQRNAGDRYSVFDPNNGAFQYAGWRDMELSLRGYMDSAFSNMDQRAGAPGASAPPPLAPFRMQIYSTDHHPGAASTPMIEPRDGPPAEPDCDSREDGAAFSNDVSIETLFPGGVTQAGLRHPWETLASYALQQVAGQRTSTLADAVQTLQQQVLARPAGGANLNASLGQAQSASVTELPDRIRHGGTIDIRGADALVSDLATHFTRPYIGDGGPLSFHNDLAVIDLEVRTPPASADGEPPSNRPVVVQRLNRAANYEQDQYQLYDPGVGVSGYDSFDQLSGAIRHIYNTGYRADGGIARATTTWFSNRAGVWAPAGGRTLSTPRALATRASANLTLDDIDRIDARAHRRPLVPARDDLLPEPPDLRAPIPHLGRPELKRSVDITAHANSATTADTTIDTTAESEADSEAEPRVLFRPSTITPEAMMAQGGFDARNTELRNINLQTHNFDVASHGVETDSAGYLGTFDTPAVAIDRMRHQSNDGYIYALAGSPNMVDVNRSLGAHALSPEDNEFAALGHIDATQVYGWWPVQQGNLSHFVDNPAFRWDVYGRTRTAGAQPQLARFPMDSPAWREATWAPFAAPVIHEGRQTGIKPRQDPNLTVAAFHLDATSKLLQTADRQASGQDYRGSIVLHAYGPGWGDILYTDDSDQVNIYGEPQAARTPGTTRQFIPGEDGRFHYPNDHDKVLRVGTDGYLFVGAIPDNPHSLNGVFQYDGTHLLHAEDGKYLTVGKSVYTPFVTDDDTGSRSSWYLTDVRGRPVAPPSTNRNTYWNSSVGSRSQLFQFDRDPDTALPAGVTRFVTHVPGNPYRGGFLGYQPSSGADQVTIDWLNEHHAAWLFRDGFYAVATGPHSLEVRTLGGKSVWHVSIDPVTRAESNRGPAHLASNYKVRDDVWQGIEERQHTYDALANAM